MNRSLLHRVGIFARLVFTYPALALGVLMIFAVCGEVLDLKLESTPKRTAEERQSRLLTRNTIRWRPDGTCHIQQSRRQVRILDLNTKVIWKGSRDDSFLKDTYLDFSKTIHYSHYGILVPHRLEQLNNPLILGGRRDVFFRVGQDNISRLETWLPAPSLDRLHRYDAKGRYSGSLGANGFVHEKRQAQGLGTFRTFFLLRNGNSMFWVTDRQIYAIDLQAQTVVPQLPDNRTLTLVERFNAGQVHAMTDDGMHYVFNRDGEPPLALRIHEKNGNGLAGSLAFSGKEKELYLYRRSGPERSAGQVCEEVLYRVGKDGLAEEVNRVEWTYLPDPATDVFILNVINPAWLGGLVKYEGRHWPLLSSLC